MSNTSRPTSPHLSIYRWQISMLTSIMHRFTGVALAIGAVLLVAWLCIAAYAPGSYGVLHELFASIFGQLLLLGWTVAFYYHLANGIRHLFWDMGKGFSIPAMNRSGWLVIIFTFAMTAMTWGFLHASVG